MDGESTQSSAIRNVSNSENRDLGHSNINTLKSSVSQNTTSCDLLAGVLLQRSHKQVFEDHADSYYLFPPDQNHCASGRYPLADVTYSDPALSINYNVDNRRLARSESDPFTKKFSRAPGTSRTTRQLFGNSDSTCARFEEWDNAQLQNFRKFQPYFAAQERTVSTQTERSLFEEKFLLRENILLGCDIIQGIGSNLPFLAEIKEYADKVREKTIQSRPQNVCTSLAHDQHQIVGEYLKTFLKIADTWLETRSCFGTNDQCRNKLCSLHSTSLGRDFIDWMYSSHQLMNSILSGLQSTTSRNVRPTSSEQHNVQENMLSRRNVHSQVGILGVNPDEKQFQQYLEQLPNHVWRDSYPFPPPVKSQSPEHFNPPGSQQMYQNWVNQQVLPIDYPSKTYMGNEYLAKGSHDVERSKYTNNDKIRNVNKAQINCCHVQDRKSWVYLADLRNKEVTNHSKKDIAELSRIFIYGSDEIFANGNAFNDKLQKQCPYSILKNQNLKDDRFDKKDESHCVPDSISTEDSQGDNGVVLTKEPNVVSRIRSQGMRRIALTSNQLFKIQHLIQELWTWNVPDFVKYPVKNKVTDYYKFVRHPIFLETISNKSKNGIYETIEQFIHDCRRMFLNASIYSQANECNNSEDFSRKFEVLLQQHFEQTYQWAHLSGDPKEASCYAELRYINNFRKRGKPAKLTSGNETA